MFDEINYIHMVTVYTSYSIHSIHTYIYIYYRYIERFTCRYCLLMGRPSLDPLLIFLKCKDECKYESGGMVVTNV